MLEPCEHPSRALWRAFPFAVLSFPAVGQDPCVKAGEAEDQERSTAVIAHIATVLLPVLGPLVVLVANRNSRFVRGHACVAALTSSAWVVGAVLVISLDNGHLSVESPRLLVPALRRWCSC